MNDLTGTARFAATPLKCIVYVSRATPGLTIDAIRLMAFESRGFNILNGITGMLSYDRRGFFQAIEGTAEAIDGLFAAICRDKRHEAIETIGDMAIAAPAFREWLDIIIEGDSVIGLSDVPLQTRKRMSAEVAAMFESGFSALDWPMSNQRSVGQRC